VSSDDLDISRLCQSIRQSRLALTYPRQVRVDMTKQLASKYYSVEGPVKPIPLNLLNLYQTIVGQKLLASNPRVMLSTWDMGNRAVIGTMERWANKQIIKQKLAQSFERCVIDSLYVMGIMKVGIATPLNSAMSGWMFSSGRVYCEPVDFDDFVYDVHCRDLRFAGFMGHRYRAPVRVVKQYKLFSKDRKDLGPMPDKLYNLEGDERIGTLGRTTMAGDEEYEESVDLWEIYLPRHRLVVTLRDDDMSNAGTGGMGKALSIRRWVGPDSGPYIILGQDIVPGNSRPAGPMRNLYDLHMAINNILRKLIRQAQRCKTLGLAGGGRTEDADKIGELSDGDMGNVSDVKNVSELTYGTPNAQLFELLKALKELFSWLAGNLEIMGGLSAQSKTKGQDELLAQNSSATISVMQGRVLDFISSVMESMCWYWHHDPTKVYRSTFQVPGSEIQIPTYSFPTDQGGGSRKNRMRVPFADLDITIDPYSLQHQTPQSRLQAITQFIQGVYLPMSQLASQQNIMLDLNQLFNLAGKYMDQPDLPTILTTAPAPQQDSSGGAGPEPSGPMNETKTYERRSLGGDTPNNRMADISNAMSKAAAQQRNGSPQRGRS
jgi:hypothetical protein